MVRFAPLQLRTINPAWTDRVPSPAHDSLTPSERAQHLAEFPDSYLGVTRGPDDISAGVPTTPAAALAAGRSALDGLLQREAFSEIRPDQFYVYRLEHEGWCQAGVIGGIHIDDYTAGSLRIHEQIHDDRARYLARHSGVVGAQSSPVAVAHHPNMAVARIVDSTMESKPMIEFTMPDGLRQSVWPIDHAHEAEIRHELAAHSLYLIDGHHRTAAAEIRHRDGGSPWLLAALFPTDQLKNTAFHRIGSGSDPGAWAALAAIPGAQSGRIGDGAGTLQLFFKGEWLTIPHRITHSSLERLDTWQFETVVRPLLGPSARVEYRNAQGDEARLLSQVLDSGDLLALMMPVSMASLFAVADAGDVMPPKSTYFEPKVRSGIFLRHL